MRWDTEPGVTIKDRAVVRALARRNAEARPQDRPGFVLPYPSDPGRRFGRTLPGVPDEMV